MKCRIEIFPWQKLRGLGLRAPWSKVWKLFNHAVTNHVLSIYSVPVTVPADEVTMLSGIRDYPCIFGWWRETIGLAKYFEESMGWVGYPSFLPVGTWPGQARARQAQSNYHLPPAYGVLLLNPQYYSLAVPLCTLLTPLPITRNTYCVISEV